jgi:hypothetical protein
MMLKKYMSSYKILENENYDIQLIEAFPCDSKDELHMNEGEHIKQTENCVNKNVVYRTDAEYYEQKKETILIKCKNYRANNKE